MSVKANSHGVAWKISSLTFYPLWKELIGKLKTTLFEKKKCRKTWIDVSISVTFFIPSFSGVLKKASKDRWIFLNLYFELYRQFLMEIVKFPFIQQNFFSVFLTIGGSEALHKSSLTFFRTRQSVFTCKLTEDIFTKFFRFSVGPWLDALRDSDQRVFYVQATEISQ